MKRALLSLLALLTLIGVVIVAVRLKTGGPARLIGVVQFVHHPLLDETHRGLMAELEKLGLNDGVHFVTRTHVADKSVEACGQMTKQFLDDGAVLIVAIATPAAQAVAAQTTNTPVIFAAITDPVAAKLVATIEQPGRNLTGTSNQWPFEKQIGLIPLVMPKAKKIGAVWNPSEVNSQAAMNSIRPLLKNAGYELVEVPVATTMDVANAVRSIADKIDAFLMIPDNTALAASTVFAEVAIETRKPLIGGDMDTVRKGSLATYGYNYFELGQVTAQMVKEIILDHKKPATIPVRYPPKAALILNDSVAQKLGITIPADLKMQAVEIVR